MYKAKEIECNNCGHARLFSKEKMTDVNIAPNMLTDAFTDIYDTAFLISGVSDLVPPIKAVHQHFPGKAVSVFFPPEKHNNTFDSKFIDRKKD